MKTYQIVINIFRIPTPATNRQTGIRVHTWFFCFGKTFPCRTRVRPCTLMGSSLCQFSFAALLWRLQVFLFPFAWTQQEYTFSLHCAPQCSTIIELWVASHQLMTCNVWFSAFFAFIPTPCKQISGNKLLFSVFVRSPTTTTLWNRLEYRSERYFSCLG